ncbi:MAG: hypothetical protein AB7V40_01955 [Methyloceanibacter sp.]
MRFFLIIAIWLAPLAALQGCATQSDASRAAELAAAESEDAATCREKSGEDEKAYDACRKAMADKRAQEAAVQEQKRRDFDRVLGAGTDGVNNY